MKLFVNELGEKRLFWFFDNSFTKKRKHFTYRHLTKYLKTFTNGLKLKNIKSHKSFRHQPSFNEISDKKNLGIGNFTHPSRNRIKKIPSSKEGLRVSPLNGINASFSGPNQFGISILFDETVT